MDRQIIRIGAALVGGMALALLLLAAGQSQARTAPQAPAAVPQWGTDIQVNPSPTGTPYHPMQMNFSLASNPANPDNVIAAWDSWQLDPGPDAYGWSTDQGRTWGGGRFNGPWNPGGMTPGGSSTVAFDAHGTGYYAGAAQGNNQDGYFVLTTTNGSAWGTPMPVVMTGATTAYNWGHLAVDPQASGLYAGSLYMFWLYTDLSYPNYYVGVRERYSRDGGHTWSADVQVSDPSNNDIYFPFGTVARDGTVYVTFEELDNYSIGSPPRLVVVRSTDGGQTWGTNQLITGAPIVPVGRADYKNRELTLLGGATCNLLRINHYPMIAVAPGDSNTVYAVWNDGRWETEDDLCGSPGHHSDVAFSRSTDGGRNWSTPARLNDDPVGNGADHFQPDIAVRADGVIGVTWLDRRYDPAHLLYDLTYSQSTDGGLTWSANQRVSDQSNNPDELYDNKGIDTVGLRRGLVFGPDYVLPSWINAMPGTLVGNFFTDHGLLATALPTATAPPSATATPTTTALTTTATATPTAATTATTTTTPAPSSTATACPLQFTDVPADNPFYVFIRCLACRGILSGYSTTPPCAAGQTPCFQPGASITRGQAAKILANAAGYTDPIPSTQQTFNDVPPTNPFWLYTERVAAHGAISGYDCGGVGEPCPGFYFRPGANLTRGQLAKIDANVGGYADPIPSTQQTFADVPYASPFWLYIERVYQHGVISGYSTNPPCPGAVPCFLPGNSVTRGQAAKIIANTFYPNCDTPRR